MNKSAHRTPFVLVIVAVVLLFIASTASILYATITLTKNQAGSQVAVVGDLKAVVTENTITVTNDMECVMRATPLARGITFGEDWVLQDSGKYYYGKVLSKSSSGQTITLTGATADNVLVELAQAQYLQKKDSSGNVTGVASGFIVEWASRNVNNNANDTLGTYTTDKLDILYNDQENNTIVMYSGHDETRRVPNSAYTEDEIRRFKATKNDGGYYVFDQINLGDDDTFETIDSSKVITLYNNSKFSVVYMFQVINNGHEPTKDSVFSNNNWTTYVDTTPSGDSRTFVKASESSVTSGYSTYFVSKIVAPGEYVDVTNGADNKLYFDSSLTEETTTIRLSVSSIDTMTFYYKIMNTPTEDKYLNWLQKLGGTYYKDFVKSFK